MNTSKYTRGYYLPPNPEQYNKWASRTHVDKAPDWCSVDLRDGNQSLIVPMTLAQKLEFFGFLVRIGFKEIEIGFPAASETEYEFCRALIERDLIPDDVAIQVLTQSREHIIRRTFEAIAGAKNAVVHFYNSTSVVQREQVFKKSKAEIIEIAVSGAKLVKELTAEYMAANPQSNYRFEYSPESFTGTEPEFGLEICNEVLKVLEPSESNKVIINLPATVEVSMPHVFAAQVEYICENLYKREHVVVSLHTHNDRGCAVAAAEMGLLAGADRVEGTLFGNGERTGNADLITLALNMYSQGIDPRLDFSNISDVVKVYDKTTGMDVHQRHPYCGELVFAAFSGSHQDAIAKGMAFRQEQLKRTEQEADLQSRQCLWNVPYLPIDPADLGRKYESDVIRVNSQSGKGGIGYILERSGVNLPFKMRESVGYAVKDISDKANKELTPDEVYDAFFTEFVNIESKLSARKPRYDKETRETLVDILYNGTERAVVASGNGEIDAMCNALRKEPGIKFDIGSQSQHSMENAGSDSDAISYIEIIVDGKSHWGAGLHSSTGKANRLALISAINRSGLV
jgi:2-isopropylmalate synthase